MSINFPQSEVAVIEKWREIKAFERQVGYKYNTLCIFLYSYIC